MLTALTVRQSQRPSKVFNLIKDKTASAVLRLLWSSPVFKACVNHLRPQAALAAANGQWQSMPPLCLLPLAAVFVAAVAFFLIVQADHACHLCGYIKID